MSETRIATQQVGSGTADSTTFLRGDQSWQALSANSIPAAGTSGATIHDDGADWVSSTNLYNDGTDIGIGVTSSLDGRLHIKPNSASEVGQVIELQSLQTADAFQIHDSSGTTLARFNKDGYLGIGVNPGFPLQVGASVAPTSDFYSLVSITGSLTSGQNAMRGLTVTPTITATSSVTTAVGTLSFPTISADTGVTITSGIAMYARGGTGNGAGSISTLIPLLVEAGYGTIKPTTAKGLEIRNVGDTGITTAIALSLVLPTNATNNYYMAFNTADNTDPSSGYTTAITGRLAVRVGSTLRWIPYY